MYEKYYALNENTIIDYLSNHQNICNYLGGDINNYRISEIGDGNLNLVFIINGKNNSLCLKQSLPYVRLVGESWPLSQKRTHFEAAALYNQYEISPNLVPKIHLYDQDMALIIMDYLDNHIILRKGFINGIIYPKLADDISVFLGNNLYNNSIYAVCSNTHRNNIKLFLDNHELCQITENLIFDDPYFDAPLNKYNSPYLDNIVGEIRNNKELKIAAQIMKYKFITNKETLLHGDLHSGSVMVNADSTKIIDPEFALYGPISFDIGMFLANIMTAYYTHNNDYKIWLSDSIDIIWSNFTIKFTDNFINHANGDVHKNHLVDRKSLIDKILTDIWHDAVGFAGCEIIRRIIGLAHLEEFEIIQDANLRSQAEILALKTGIDLLINRNNIKKIVL